MGGGTDDRGVLAVGGGEGVVDVEVLTFDEALDEARVVVLLAGVEAQVVHELHLGDQLGQPVADGAQLEAGIAAAPGPAEVGGDGDVGAAAHQPLEGGGGGPDAKIVDHPVPADGDVEVAADEHPLPPDGRQILELGQVVRGKAGPHLAHDGARRRDGGRMRTLR